MTPIQTLAKLKISYELRDGKLFINGNYVKSLESYLRGRMKVRK